MGFVVKQIHMSGRLELAFDPLDSIQIVTERSNFGKMVVMMPEGREPIRMTNDEAIELAHLLMGAAEQ